MSNPYTRFILKITFFAFIFLLSGELGARLLLERPMSVQVTTRQNHLDTSLNGVSLFDISTSGNSLYYRTNDGWRLSRNAIAHVQNHFISKADTVITTNSLGLRGPELGDKVLPRVLFLGDSITEQGYLDESDTIVRQVEALSRNHALPVQAINAGISTAGTAAEVQLFSELRSQIDPDIVVLNIYLNDVSNCCAIHVPNLPKIATHSWFISGLFKIAFIYMRPGLNYEMNLTELQINEWKMTLEDDWNTGKRMDTKDPLFRQLVYENFRVWGNAWSSETWRVLKPYFAKLQLLTHEQKKTRLFFVIFPVRPQLETNVDTTFPQIQMAKIAEELAVPLLDLLPVLRPFATSDIYFDESHPTAKGSKVIARAIFDFLLNKERVYRLADAR